jgi:hypothetical protein
MKTLTYAVLVAIGIIGIVSTASASHEADWTKTFWEELSRNNNGG